MILEPVAEETPASLAVLHEYVPVSGELRPLQFSLELLTCVIPHVPALNSVSSSATRQQFNTADDVIP